MQVGRFEYSAEANRSRSVKRRFVVVPSLDIQAALIHKGLSPASGHYVALLYDCDETHNVWVAHDGAPAVRTNDDVVTTMYRDVSMLYYTRTA